MSLAPSGPGNCLQWRSSGKHLTSVGIRPHPPDCATGSTVSSRDAVKHVQLQVGQEVEFVLALRANVLRHAVVQIRLQREENASREDMTRNFEPSDEKRELVAY